MDRFVTGNRIVLLRSGVEYFPALERAIDSARIEIWLETYIFADDPTGRRIADVLASVRDEGTARRIRVMLEPDAPEQIESIDRRGDVRGERLRT